MPHHFLVQARPAAQPVPLLYAARRYNTHHGGRLVVVRRQALTWHTRRAAEKWLQIEQSTWGNNPIYGKMHYEVLEEGTPIPEEQIEYVFLDGRQERVVLPVDSTEAALEIARLHQLQVLLVKYRISGQKLLADYRNPKEQR